MAEADDKQSKYLLTITLEVELDCPPVYIEAICDDLADVLVSPRGGLVEVDWNLRFSGQIISEGREQISIDIDKEEE